MSMKASDHAADCGWHFEQYPAECDCGAVTGKLGMATVDHQAAMAAYTTLQRKAQTFEHYARLHKDKGTEDGDRKAAANQKHADDIHKVLAIFEPKQVTEPIPTPVIDAMESQLRMFELETGEQPAGIVMTTNLLKRLGREYESIKTIGGPSTAAILGSVVEFWCGIRIYPAKETDWHSGIVFCREQSPILQAAKVKFERQ